MTSVRPRAFRFDWKLAIGIVIVAFMVWLAVGIAASTVSWVLWRHF